LRRLRIDPLETVSHLAEDIGPRSPTSLAEAQASAFVNGRMRLAGVRVSSDPFPMPAPLAWDGALITGLSFGGALLSAWFAGPAFVWLLAGLGLALWRVRRPEQPLLARRRTSQNVVGIRAFGQTPRQRVVLLAPVDSPPALGPLLRAVVDGDRAHLGRVLALALQIGLGVAELFIAQLNGWYLQFVPVVFLLLLAVVDIGVGYRRGSPGAISHAGALAALLAVTEELQGFEATEVWLVGLGGTATGAGMADLLRRYPFERDTTLFIGIEGIGRGKLAYVTREGLLQMHPADPLLLRLVAAADSADPAIDAEPRAYRHSPTIAGWLRRRGWRALTITCLDTYGRVPYRATAQDLPDAIDGETIQRAARLAAGLVRQIGMDAANRAG
jgi:hypothetical protein